MDSQHTTDHGQKFSLPSQFDSTQIADQITAVVLYVMITATFFRIGWINVEGIFYFVFALYCLFVFLMYEPRKSEGNRIK